MVNADDYGEYVDVQNSSKNFASLIMMIMGIICFITLTLIKSDVFGMQMSTARNIVGFVGVALFFLGLVVRFFKLKNAIDESQL